MDEVVFFNVWTTESAAAQKSLLAAMRVEAPALASMPGFLSLRAWAGQNDHRVIVEGRWASETEFRAAVVDNPEALAARRGLELFGKSEPGSFVKSFEQRSQAVELDSARDSTAFIQVWDVGTVENQEAWLATMRSKVGALTDQPGFDYLGAHKSIDGKRIAVYAQWRDRASLSAAVGTPEAMAAHQALSELGTPDGAEYRLAEAFVPERTNVLRNEASRRWQKLGFDAGMVSLGDIELYVATGGRGRPLLLLHGYPQSGEIWRFVAPELAKSRRVIIPDLRGMGLSTIAPTGYALPELAIDIRDLLARLDVGEADVCGHDWGAAVGAAFALFYRSSALTLTFIESAVAGAGFESIWRFDKPNPAMTFIPLLLTESLAESLLAGREELFLRHLWNKFTHNKSRVPFESWRPYVEAMKRPGLVRSSASFYRAVYGAMDTVRETIQNGKITIPVLSVAGGASFGAAQRNFVEAFASNIAKQVVIDGAGHFVAEEQPDALAAGIQAFLAA